MYTKGPPLGRAPLADPWASYKTLCVEMAAQAADPSHSVLLEGPGTVRGPSNNRYYCRVDKMSPAIGGDIGLAVKLPIHHTAFYWRDLGQSAGLLIIVRTVGATRRARP